MTAADPTILPASSFHETDAKLSVGVLFGLAYGSLGGAVSTLWAPNGIYPSNPRSVVFGDLATSPLYTYSSLFQDNYGNQQARAAAARRLPRPLSNVELRCSSPVQPRAGA